MHNLVDCSVSYRQQPVFTMGKGLLSFALSLSTAPYNANIFELTNERSYRALSHLKMSTNF